MGGKQRLVGPGGAVFVPNCDEQTIVDRIASGEWTKFDEPKPPKAAKAKSKPPPSEPPAGQD
jgi:hypothetical protein